MTDRRSKYAAPAAETESKKDKWVVTWWQLKGGALEMSRSEHDNPSSARVEYVNKDKGSDAGLWRSAWDESRQRWDMTNLIADEITPLEQANINRKGLAVVRAVLAHRGGKDARGLSIKSLDAELADDNPARPTRRQNPEPLVTEDPVDCVVCDYAMEHCLAADHLVVPVAARQEQF
jgi:hypothetical protein